MANQLLTGFDQDQYFELIDQGRSNEAHELFLEWAHDLEPD